LSQGLSEKEVLSKFEGRDVKILQERIKYAKVWLKDYAPDEYKFEMTKEIPEDVKKLTFEQKEYLKGVINFLRRPLKRTHYKLLFMIFRRN